MIIKTSYKNIYTLYLQHIYTYIYTITYISKKYVYDYLFFLSGSKVTTNMEKDFCIISQSDYYEEKDL